MPEVLADTAVRYYDASSTEEAGMASFYFHPPLGEAIVTDLVAEVAGSTYSDVNVGGVNVDHLRFSSSDTSIVLSAVRKYLRREGRHLVTGNE